eukprot:scaffold185695_cov15-Tisochrysis_lutea.AAC.1
MERGSMQSAAHANKAVIAALPSGVPSRPEPTAGAPPLLERCGPSSRARCKRMGVSRAVAFIQRCIYSKLCYCSPSQGGQMV